jgi:hypothetical protein
MIQKSGQSAADTVGQYMNPYNEAVTNRIATLGARNLQENLMPAINQDFIRAGQYGSTGQMNEVGKALRDTQESVLAKQADVLQQGYGQAMTNAQTDLSRYGDLAQTTGNLSNADSQMQLDSARVQGGLGTVAQDARYADINALGAVGNSVQDMQQSNLDMAYKDFTDQRAVGEVKALLLAVLCSVAAHAGDAVLFDVDEAFALLGSDTSVKLQAAWTFTDARFTAGELAGNTLPYAPAHLVHAEATLRTSVGFGAGLVYGAQVVRLP